MPVRLIFTQIKDENAKIMKRHHQSCLTALSMILTMFVSETIARSVPSFLDCEALDLTYTLNDRVPIFPHQELVANPYVNVDMINMETEATDTKGSVYYLSGKFSMAEHIGTHIDSPTHVVDNRAIADANDAMDRVPLHKLVGEACVVDLPEHAKGVLDYKLTVDDLTKWERRNGRIDEGCFVILRTGLGKYWNDEQRYFGAATKEDVHTVDENGFPYKLHWPSFSYESSAWLVANREFVGVGIDAVSIDTGDTGNFYHSAHTAILSSNRVGIENLANIDKLPTRGATIIALPLKMEDASGAPARIIAYGWQGVNDPCSMNYRSTRNDAKKLGGGIFAMIFAIFITIVLL